MPVHSRSTVERPFGVEFRDAHVQVHTSQGRFLTSVVVVDPQGEAFGRVGSQWFHLGGVPPGGVETILSYNSQYAQVNHPVYGASVVYHSLRSDYCQVWADQTARKAIVSTKPTRAARRQEESVYDKALRERIGLTASFRPNAELIMMRRPWLRLLIKQAPTARTVAERKVEDPRAIVYEARALARASGAAEDLKLIPNWHRRMTLGGPREYITAVQLMLLYGTLNPLFPRPRSPAYWALRSVSGDRTPLFLIHP